MRNQQGVRSNADNSSDQRLVQCNVWSPLVHDWHALSNTHEHKYVRCGVPLQDWNRISKGGAEQGPNQPRGAEGCQPCSCGAAPCHEPEDLLQSHSVVVWILLLQLGQSWQ